MISPGHKQISIRKQCELLGLNRSSYYSGQHPFLRSSPDIFQAAVETEENLQIMGRLDELYMKSALSG